MKKHTLLIQVTILGLLLSGCGEMTAPDNTVEQFFTAAQELEIGSMAALIDPSNTDDIDELVSLIDGQGEDFPDFLVEYITMNAKKIDYDITNSEVNGDNATVTVICEYVDGGPILLASVQESYNMVYAQIMAGVEITDEEMIELLSTILQEKIETTEETYRKVAIDIDLIKKDGTWYKQEVSDELYDVLVSGLISASNELSGSFD